jgi:hypothetical protein
MDEHDQMLETVRRLKQKLTDTDFPFRALRFYEIYLRYSVREGLLPSKVKKVTSQDGHYHLGFDNFLIELSARPARFRIRE